MKVVSVKQNGKEWREWRGRGLGASDAPIIMGESPYQSPFELWLDKTGIKKREAPNEYALAAMKRGTELEPTARHLYEKLSGKSYEVLSAEHDKYDFIRASFDGVNLADRSIIEIKCPGKEAHATALKGKVPKYYYAQVQQQLMVSGLDKCYYVSWDGVMANPLVVVEVLPDKEYQAKLLAELIDFWKRITEKVLPSVSDKDIIKLIKTAEDNLASLTNVVSVFKSLSGVSK
jgi:putative phage-type endonuclease